MRLFLEAVFGWLFLVALTGHQTHVGRVFLVHMQPVDVYFARPTGLFGVRIDFVHGGTSNDVPAKRGALVVVSRDPHPRHFSFKTSHKHHIKIIKNDQVKQAKGACLFIVVAVKFHNEHHQYRRQIILFIFTYMSDIVDKNEGGGGACA